MTDFKVGDAVEMLVPSTGGTSEGHEITLPPYTQGRVLSINNQSMTVGIGDSIVNVFDDTDGDWDQLLRKIEG